MTSGDGISYLLILIGIRNECRRRIESLEFPSLNACSSDAGGSYSKLQDGGFIL